MSDIYFSFGWRNPRLRDCDMEIEKKKNDTTVSSARFTSLEARHFSSG